MCHGRARAEHQRAEPVAAVQSRRRGVDRREPARRRRAGDGELQQVRRRRAAGDAVVRCVVAAPPCASSPRIVLTAWSRMNARSTCTAVRRAAAADSDAVDGRAALTSPLDRRRTACCRGGPACVVARRRSDRRRRAPARRAPPSTPSDARALRGLALAAGGGEQAPIRARRLREDSGFHERQEPFLAVCEPVADDRASLVEREPRPQESRQPGGSRPPTTRSSITRRGERARARARTHSSTSSSLVSSSGEWLTPRSGCGRRALPS